MTEQVGVAAQVLELQHKKRKAERWLTIIASGSGAILLGFILWGIIYKLIIVKGVSLIGFAFLAFVLGMVALLILTIYRQTLNEEAAKLTRQSTQQKNATTAKALPNALFQPVGSVTEHTTELLAAEPKRDTKEI